MKEDEGLYLASGEVNTYYLLSNANVLMKAREYEGAKALLLAALKTGTQDVIAFFGLGLLYEQLGQYETAHRCLEDALRAGAGSNRDLSAISRALIRLQGKIAREMIL